jgi:uncharacterized protein (TIGR00299 family) protein
MKRILYLDVSAGVSGDMFVGALLDLGASIEVVRGHVAALGIEGIEVRARKVKKSGLPGTKFDVVEPLTGCAVEAAPAGTHGHRGLREIREILGSSALPGPVAADALGVFELLGRAEGKVHGVDPEEIHFHEVGALDAIADIVSAASAFHQLGTDEAWCSPIHVGSGTVRCAHGVLPVPAPATAELLEGAPTYSNGVRGELATPTGAALVRYFCRGFCAMPQLAVERVGYGAGSKDFGIPNVLRAVLGRVSKRVVCSQAAQFG